MSITPIQLAAHRHELRQHSATIRASWMKVPDIADRLRYENSVGAHTCHWIIGELRAVQTVPEAAARFVDLHPLIVSLPTRMLMHHLPDLQMSMQQAITALEHDARNQQAERTEP